MAVTMSQAVEIVAQFAGRHLIPAGVMAGFVIIGVVLFHLLDREDDDLGIERI